MKKADILKEINKAITHIARGSGFTVEEVKSIIADEYIDEDDYTVICWPEIQELIDKEGFEENACLANSEEFIDMYGCSAYFVNKKWLKD